MKNSQYLLIAAIGLFLLVIIAGTALLVVPLLLDRQAQELPTSAPTEPVVVFPSGTPIVIVITSTPLPVLPSATPGATSGATNQPTAGPSSTVPPTVPPTASTVPSATPIPLPCDWASFVKDISIPDGTDMVPGEDFVKTWRIKNVGSCTWTTEYDLVFSSGNSMGAQNSVALPGTVKPGETIDISVAMVAPDDEASYNGFWMLRNGSGNLFGIGADRDNPVWVKIDVILPCYWVKFVADITVPDGTNFSPNVPFVKTWRLQNIGDCDWTSSFDVVHVSGDKMGATIADIPVKVEPGESIDVSAALTAPDDPDDYRGFWMIKASDGTIFGLGDDQDDPFWVDIDVIESDNEYKFDFAENYCSAVWKSGVGTLPCPGQSGNDNGFVIKLNNPDLENKKENEPALWTVPNDDGDGYISGKFPAVQIANGDHFMAWVGCLDDSEGCKVTFYLDYQVDGGPVQSMGSWDEVYDGQVTVIDIDLSSLAGKNVTFILSVEVDNSDPDDANAFWFAPRIE